MIVSRTELDREALAALNAGDLLDDKRDYTGVIVKKPWGHEFQVYKNSRFSAWQLCINPNSETSMHCHPNKTTILIVVDGIVVISTLHQRAVYQKGQMLIVEAGVFHRTSTADGAIVMEIESPPNKNDLVRLEDRYGRAGRGYECA